ncbi:LANO_0D11254g1_1 [Lachancea nothofagi CBS 11611]|uniref:LANO_0D11254g1_1 n=1 Tax=Lachancea nothofagi CBS 11611 TaxID=1266666 RepID=A0A1G4JL69_9SACH|nr:LANO_0D11254g1_1 [Lachancea nothofagi CBS 11611]
MSKLVPIASPGLHTSNYEGTREKEHPLSTNDSKEDYVTGIDAISNESKKRSGHLPLQAYIHYAEIQRQYEKADDSEGLYALQQEQMTTDPNSNISTAKLNTHRTLRIAKVYSVFFLITTDILGPTNAPYAVAQMGWAPGVILYVLFGVFAALGGWLLNRCYCKVDSNNYPIRTFSDLAGRIVAPWFKYPFAILQFIQMILNCGVLLLGTAQAVSQMQIVTRGHDGLCFTVDILVWGILCMILGQIKSLGKFAYIANSAVWMNIAICIITMVGVAVGGPYYGIFQQYGQGPPYFKTGTFDPLPIVQYAVAPGTISDRISGMNNMVFAWGGATIFCEVMAEMKRPMDFWKGMICAQILILVVYLFYGLFVYGYDGQFSYVTANQGIGSIGLQNAGNVLNIITQIIAAVLYGNVGVKVFYQGFLVSNFKFPSLDSRKGTLAWGSFVVIYWAVAYIIGTAIPSVSALVSIIGAFCIFNFSYTFPFLFAFCLLCRQDAGLTDRFDPLTLTVEKADSYWSGLSRWKRALGQGGIKRSLIKISLLLLCLASLATCGLCSYSAIEGAIAAYQTNFAQPFTCASPVA